MRKYQHIVLSVMLALVAGSAVAAEKKSSIPQMDQASYPGQLVWLGISFVLLYAIVSVFVAPRVGGVLNARKSAIADAIAKAEELKAAAADTRGNFEAAGADARAKAAALIAAAQADSTKATNDALATLAAELEVKAQASKASIAKAVAKAQAEMETAAQSLSAAMTAKLLGDVPQAVAKKKAS